MRCSSRKCGLRRGLEQPRIGKPPRNITHTSAFRNDRRGRLAGSESTKPGFSASVERMPLSQQALRGDKTLALKVHSRSVRRPAAVRGTEPLPGLVSGAEMATLRGRGSRSVIWRLPGSSCRVSLRNYE